MSERNIESIVVVGSFATGKNTLVDGVRSKEYQDEVVVPNLYTAQSVRFDADQDESEYIDHEAFRDGVERGVITPHWSLPKKNEQWERYGFNMVAEDDDRLRVYSANNAFLRNPTASTKEVLKNSLVILVTARSSVRGMRMRKASPGMRSSELDAHMRDSGTDLVKLHEPMKIICTSDMVPEEGQLALRGIVDQHL